MPSFSKNGITYAILASLLFSLMNLAVKMVADTLPVSEIVLFRSLFGLVVVYGTIRYRGLPLQAKRPGILLLRGMLGAAAIWGGFLTIAHIKLGDAAILANTSPIFVALFAGYFLSERITAKNLALLGLSLVGVFLVIKPNSITTYTFYTVVGLGTAIISAGASVTIRALTKDHSTQMIVLSFMGVTCLAMLLPTIIYFVTPTLLDVLWLLVIGLSSLAAQVCLTQAYRFTEAGSVATARLSSVAWNILWGILIWGEYLDMLSTVGGALVIVSCYLLYRETSSNLSNREKAKLAS